MKKKILSILLFLVIISWASLAVFAFLFMRVRIQNTQLKDYNRLLERKVTYSSDEFKRHQEKKAREKRLEDNVVDYLEWQYVLKDQVEQAKARLTQNIDKIKELKKNRDLLNLLYYNLGLSYILAVDFNSAIQAFEKALQFAPLDALSCYNLGLLYSTSKQDNKKAVKYYKKYLEVVGPSRTSKAEEVKRRLEILEPKNK